VSFVDGLTVGPATSNVRFTSAIDGTFSGVAAGNVHFNLHSFATNSLIVYDDRLFVFELSPSMTKIYNLTLNAGSYLFDWSMDASAVAVSGRFSYVPKSAVDLSHTGTLNIDGEGLTFLSGHDYRSFASPSPVPEPSTWAFMLLGVAGMVSTANRRKSGGVSAWRWQVACGAA
jgi:hypothetical protein